jgi:hypothetical protein
VSPPYTRTTEVTIRYISLYHLSLRTASLAPVREVFINFLRLVALSTDLGESCPMEPSRPKIDGGRTSYEHFRRFVRYECALTPITPTFTGIPTLQPQDGTSVPSLHCSKGVGGLLGDDAASRFAWCWWQGPKSFFRVRLVGHVGCHPNKL